MMYEKKAKEFDEKHLESFRKPSRTFNVQMRIW